MSEQDVELCLCHLRVADEILMRHGDLRIAVHLALVIELLEERQVPLQVAA